jgi:KDO2-lipid IV(A) lauroyltransferase
MFKRTVLQNYIEYIFLNAFIFFIKLIKAEKKLKNIEKLLFFFMYYIFKIRKKHVLEMLELSFPDKTSHEIEIIAKEVYITFIDTILKFIFFDKNPHKKKDIKFIYKNEKTIEKYYSEGKGIIFMSAHFGNWEIMPLLFPKMKTSVVVASQSNKFVNNMINNIRIKQGLKIINKDKNIIKNVIECLRNNEIVIFLADQDAGCNGIFVPFFKRLSSTPKGPAFFSLLTGSPIVIGFAIKNIKKKSIDIEFIDVNIKRTGNKVKDIESINIFYSKKLEDVVCKYPEQWFWFHKKWKTQPIKIKKFDKLILN